MVNHSGQWSGWDTRRGKFGSYGMNMYYDKQYVVYVHRRDIEKVKHLVNRALRDLMNKLYATFIWFHVHNTIFR